MVERESRGRSGQSTFMAGNHLVRHPVHMNSAPILLVKFASNVSHEARNNLRSPRVPYNPFHAQLFHNRKQCEERPRMSDAKLASVPVTNYFCPIVADADTGHG